VAINTTAGLAAGALVSAAGPAAADAQRAARVAPAACRAPAPRAVAANGAPAGTASATGAPRTTRAPLAARVRSVPAAVFRVNQIGYPSAATKLAALMTRSSRAGAGWVLVSRHPCRVVASGITRTNLGSWSHRYPAVWAIRFSGVQPAGTYRLALTAHPATVSPWFRIDPASSLYAGAVANALSFYQTERDGPNFIAGANGLRTAPAHLNDQNAQAYLTPHVNSSGRFSGDLTPIPGVHVDGSGG